MAAGADEGASSMNSGGIVKNSVVDDDDCCSVVVVVVVVDVEDLSPADEEIPPILAPSTVSFVLSPNCLASTGVSDLPNAPAVLMRFFLK